MTIDAKPVKKSIVSDLEFDVRTSKRVAWSRWEFTVVAPFEIEVCNASYGFEKNEHTYRVMVDEQGIPVSCTCKGFTHYHSPNGRVCKHMLAVAVIGGPTLLNAAVAFSPHSEPSGETETETMYERLKPDGGAPEATVETETEAETCPNDDPHCDGPDAEELCCFECYLSR
ncbi:SWIM zinc finger family protein [Haloquadratum walsbyi]|uniref:SWIM zinc finger containing protein n=1 Tax=Haloquadratum walsbyi J07HQW2 TaxID=1238425 RepID=U1PUF3_9EURY|nr:SWIM zinc finger family protein [Haloquadratum walsbyi]ERG96001.1 MAG: SWIM zinc finger containing protein [Haloquadratum walsbyi J07HQW2]